MICSAPLCTRTAFYRQGANGYCGAHKDLATRAARQHTALLDQKWGANEERDRGFNVLQLQGKDARRGKKA